MGTPSRRPRERLRDAGRRGRRPLPRMPREHHAPVPAALRPGVPPGRARRPRRAARMGRHRDASGTRAAGDVGPYHGCPVNTMRPCRPRCAQTCRLVGRDVPGAPRAWDAIETPTGTPPGRGPPGTSAPTRRYHATRGLTCFHLQRFRGVPSDRHPPIPCSR